AGRELLLNLDFGAGTRRDDFHLRGVVEACIVGDDGYDIARMLCENLRQAAVAHKTYGFGHNEFLKAAFKIQPRATLDALLTGDDLLIAAGRRLIDQSAHLQPNPISEVSEGILFEWCSHDPLKRYTTIASVAPAFTVSADHNPVDWTPLASRLVHSAP